MHINPCFRKFSFHVNATAFTLFQYRPLIAPSIPCQKKKKMNSRSAAEIASHLWKNGLTTPCACETRNSTTRFFPCFVLQRRIAICEGSCFARELGNLTRRGFLVREVYRVWNASLGHPTVKLKLELELELEITAAESWFFDSSLSDFTRVPRPGNGDRNRFAKPPRDGRKYDRVTHIKCGRAHLRNHLCGVLM